MSKLTDWFRRRKQEREQQARSMERMLSDEERERQEIPAETYLSQSRD